MPAPTVLVYVYRSCETCRKALKFLKERGIVHQALPIREQPPAAGELARMLKATGSLRRLFNTSGGDYKTMALAERLPDMTDIEALDLLARHGNLVKRPFLLLPDGRGTTGFKCEEWEALFAVSDTIPRSE